MESMKEPEYLTELKRSELNLLQAQSQSPNRNRAIALTYIQTAILWLERDNNEIHAKLEG